MGEVIDFARERAIRGSDLEDCVSCLIQTEVRESEPIDQRPNYVEGTGQMCASCYGDNIQETKKFAEVLELSNRGYE